MAQEDRKEGQRVRRQKMEAQRLGPEEGDVCKDPFRRPWQRVAESFRGVGGCAGADSWIKAECEAGARVIERLLHCQESDGQAFDSVRAIYWKVWAVLGPQGKCQQELNALRDSLEKLCRVAPELDGKKTTSTVQEPAAFENAHSTYRTLLEIEETGTGLKKLAQDIQDAIKNVEPHLPTDYCQELSDPFASALSKAVEDLNTATGDAETAAASCDAQAVRDKFEALEASVAQLTFAHGNLLCGLGRIKCLAQPAFFDMLQRKVDEFGFLAATVVSALGKLRLQEMGLGRQLKTLWLAMRAQVSDQLKQAFEKWQERQLCPPSLCYDTATSTLRKAIDDGVADSDKFPSDPACCDEQKVCHHRQLVDKATDEVEKLYCKVTDQPDFNTCVLTRLGSLTMQLQATLGRSTTGLVDSFQTTIKGWNDTIKYLQSIGSDQVPRPTPRVADRLRTIAGIYRWLENKMKSAAGWAICNEPVSSVSYTGAFGVGARAISAPQVQAAWQQFQQLVTQARAQSLLSEEQLNRLNKIQAQWNAASTQVTVAAKLLEKYGGALKVYIAQNTDAASKQCVPVPAGEQSKLAALQKLQGQVMQVSSATL